jgi:hypothetical protein
VIIFGWCIVAFYATFKDDFRVIKLHGCNTP